MRSDRALVLHKEGIFGNILSSAFDLGVPWATNASLHHTGPSSRIFFDYSKRKCPQCVSYLTSGFNSPQRPGTTVAHSRPKNFHFDRPERYQECYYARVGCPPPGGPVNTAKQEINPERYCGESLALRRLILGPGPGLTRLAPLFTSHWSGHPSRLEALLTARTTTAATAAATATATTSGRGEVAASFNHSSLTHRSSRNSPIWAVAIHARVEFQFVEQGKDEREPESVAAVQQWLGSPATQTKLRDLVALAVKEVKAVKAKRQRQRRERRARRERLLRTRRRLEGEEDESGGILLHGRGISGRIRGVDYAAAAASVKRRSEASSSSVAPLLAVNTTKKTRVKAVATSTSRRLASAGDGSGDGGGGGDEEESEKRAVAVYVASETALVRRHIADLAKAAGCEVDYFMLSGASHPVAEVVR
jgi:hypothetical protein